MAIRKFSTSSISTGTKSSKFWDQTTGSDAISLIASTTLSSDQTQIEFTNISQAYDHLQVYISARSDNASSESFVAARFNSDSGTNYHFVQMYGTKGGTRSGGWEGSRSSMPWERIPAGNAGSYVYGAMIQEVYDYSNTNKHTTTRGYGGWDDNSGGAIYFNGNRWANTAAVTTLTLLVGDNLGTAKLKSGTTVQLFGIKGS